MGDNTIPTYTTLSIIAVQHINLIKTVLAGDYVPRNSAGVATTAAGSLGTSTYEWLAASIRLLNLGLSADGVSLSVDGSGDIIIKRATVEIGKIDVGGFIGSGLKDGTVSNSKRIYGGTGTTAGQDGYALSASTGTYFMSGAYADVTNATCTITSAGRPIKVGLVHDGNISNEGYIGNSGTTGTLGYRIFRDATIVSLIQTTPYTSELMPVSTISHTDVVAAGTYTYKLQARSGGSMTNNVAYAKLEAYEI